MRLEIGSFSSSNSSSFVLNTLSLVLAQCWRSDENHDHWEAAERHACPADTDWHTPGVRCASLLWFEHSLILDDQNLGQPHLALSCILPGSSQGAEQWDHQRCIYAPLQGLGQTVCILQWWDHQPIRSVVQYIFFGIQKDGKSVCWWVNLLFLCVEKFFKMKKSECKEALEIYKRFLTRVTKIGEFMKLAEVGLTCPLSLDWHSDCHIWVCAL